MHGFFYSVFLRDDFAQPLVRPMVLGKREGPSGSDWCIASEDCAFGPIGFTRLVKLYCCWLCPTACSDRSHHWLGFGEWMCSGDVMVI